MKKISLLVISVLACASIHAQSWSANGNANTTINHYLGTSDNKPFRIRTNGTFRAIFDSLGNMGIGTATPTGKLSVVSTTTQNLVNLDNQRVSSLNNSAISALTRNTGSGGAIGVDITALGGGGGDNMGAKIYVQDGANNMALYVSALSNVGQTAYGLRASAIGAGTNYAVWGQASGTGNYAGYFDGVSYFSGNVGVGTTPGSTRLSVFATDVANPAFKVNINGTPRLTVNGNGSVSIGTTLATAPVAGLYVAGNVHLGSVSGATGYKLAVGGKIICEEVKVELQANWPDYVFDSNYKLMSLDELENHVNDCKHLPGIPPASEMEKSGIAIGEMQTKLVEKVEELTLYIIQLKNEIDSLKSQK